MEYLQAYSHVADLLTGVRFGEANQLHQCIYLLCGLCETWARTVASCRALDQTHELSIVCGPIRNHAFIELFVYGWWRVATINVFVHTCMCLSVCMWCVFVYVYDESITSVSCRWPCTGYV